MEVCNLKINFRMLLPVIVGLFVLPMFAQSAHAGSLDFFCTTTIGPCGGVLNATFSGGVATTGTASGVTVLNDTGPDFPNPFTLAFDINGASPNISLVEQLDDGSTLTGTVLSATGSAFGSNVDLNLLVSWTGLPADFAAFLGAPAGVGFDTNIFIQDSVGQSIDVNIQPTPEPATLLLFGTGLLGLGGLVRRKLNV